MWLDDKKAIEIIMKDGSTRKEAEKHLKDGIIFYTIEDKADFIKEFADNYIDEAEGLEEAERCWNELAKVEYEDEVYYLNYTL